MMRKIALAALLLAFFVVVPALAEPDVTYYPNPMVLNDDSGLKIYLTNIVSSDTPLGSYVNNYPASQYRFYDIYYRTENPNDNPVTFQYNISLVDANGNEYTPIDPVEGGTIPANFQATGSVSIEYAVPRDVMIQKLKWYHLNTYLMEWDWDYVTLTTSNTPTAAPTGTPSSTTATPTSATPTTAPTATAKPSPADPLLPLLAVGIVGITAMIAYARRTQKK